jgi:hypothetical protein
MSTGIASAAWSEEDSCDYRRSQGRRVTLVTLGIIDNIDFLAAANFFHGLKDHGHFEKVLQYLKSIH